jgi:hypothetical protein
MAGFEGAMAALQEALARAARPGGRSPAHNLHYPLYPPPRVAVLGLELRGPRGVHCLPHWSGADLKRLRPHALAGWWNDLAEAARLVLAGELDLACLQYPIVVFLRPERAPLPARCHDRLWEWFGVPTFEQIRLPDGELLAYECEARDGYHLASAEAAEWLGAVRSSLPCACGSPMPVYRIAAARAASAR